MTLKNPSSSARKYIDSFIHGGFASQSSPVIWWEVVSMYNIYIYTYPFPKVIFVHFQASATESSHRRSLHCKRRPKLISLASLRPWGTPGTNARPAGEVPFLNRIMGSVVNGWVYLQYMKVSFENLGVTFSTEP